MHINFQHCVYGLHAPIGYISLPSTNSDDRHDGHKHLMDSVDDPPPIHILPDSN